MHWTISVEKLRRRPGPESIVASSTGSHAAIDRLRSEVGKRKATRTGSPQECSRPVGGKGTGYDSEMVAVPRLVRGCDSRPHLERLSPLTFLLIGSDCIRKQE